MHKYFVIYMVLHLMIVITSGEPHFDLYQECAKFYHPENYMNHLPSLNLPYTGDVPMPINVGLTGIGFTAEGIQDTDTSAHLGTPSRPLFPGHLLIQGLKIQNNPAIEPSPVVKTKAINIVTKYIYKNPVCVKFSKGKNMCKKNGGPGKVKGNYEQLVTKEYFVKDRKKDEGSIQRNRKMFDDDILDG